MTLLDELIAHRAEIYAIAVKHGVKDIRVFGSVARREEREDSDVDFLITMQKGKSAFDLIHFMQDTAILCARKCDVVTEEMLHWYIRDKVLQEAKPL